MSVAPNLDPLILDFLEWIGAAPRAYAEVMEAWRTSCPRLTVFEDSIDRGFAVRGQSAGNGRMIAITDAGRDFLRDNGRMVPGGERVLQFGGKVGKDGRR
jgi:hypothetical protein